MWRSEKMRVPVQGAERGCSEMENMSCAMDFWSIL